MDIYIMLNSIPHYKHTEKNNTALFIAGCNYLSSLHSLKEQIAELYQAIHTSGNVTLLQQYEEIVQSLITQSLDSRLECEQLETSLKR